MIRAIGDNIWFVKDAGKPCIEDGILIPERCERTPRFGPSVLATVHSVGSRVVNLKPGMRIVVKDVAGDDYIYDDKTYTRCREKDIVGIANE
jgi:co-chaperonin GroES (HSP10)